MSQAPYGMSPSEERDQAADDCDEAAAHRDRASTARDVEAEERDRRAQGRMQTDVHYAELTRRLLDAPSQPNSQDAGVDHNVIQKLLSHLEQTLSTAQADRQAAASDRLAAAADREHAAEDRFLQAGHREQAAVERAQRAAGVERADRGRGHELLALADSVRSRAEAAIQRAVEFGQADGSQKEVLRLSELARLRAQLASMPVIEQANGVLMAQTGCGPDVAFDVLRQASQRLNQPVRDLAAQIVAGALGKPPPVTGRANGPVPARPPGSRPNYRQ